MTFLNRVFRGKYLIVDRDYGILDRDILNQIPLFLDGPNLKWNGENQDR